MQRRTFLQGSLAALAGVHLRAPTLAWAKEAGLYELTARPANYESTRNTFTTRITPLDRFYIRNHFDLPVGDAKTLASTWKLEVRGLAAKPQAFTLFDLTRLTQHTVEAVLQCAGNGRGLFTPRVPGVQWRYGAMGNAEWTGVRLADLLTIVKPDKAAKHLELRGLDKPVIEKTPPFIRGIPIEKALHPDTIVALQMNGKPLSLQHGFPARLVVPGWVGDDWMKWLSTIDLRADEPTAFYYATGYRFPTTPGAPGAPVPPEQMKPMTKLVVKSQLATVSDGDVIAPGTHELVGVAFSGEARIKSVDITVDGGTTWQPAKLEADSDYGFRVFRHPWEAKPGKVTIAARATDATGATQPAKPIWNPAGYLYNAIEFVSVEVRS
ncbi:MAG: sulfite oxidase [Deltaproteobacteria bacterium]|nr:sulfite oxidase [Deltaproteobacteria bacterium]